MEGDAPGRGGPAYGRTVTSAGALVGLLAETDRLRAVAALALGARTTAEVAERGQLDHRAAVRALNRLQAGGLVARAGDGWALLAEQFGQAARDSAPVAEPADHGAPDAASAAVLRAFVRDGRLVSIPAVRSKRRVVLDHVARLFEPGHRYPEREVNALLRAFHPDYAALRRHLVDEEFLDRESGEYWRAGGTVEV